MMVHPGEDTWVRTFLTTVGAAAVRIVVGSSRAPVKLVMSAVLGKEKVAPVPPVLSAGIFLEYNNGTLPVVAVVVILGVVEAVDDAPRRIASAVDTVHIHGEGLSLHKWTAVRVPIIRINTVGTLNSLAETQHSGWTGSSYRQRHQPPGLI